MAGLFDNAPTGGGGLFGGLSDFFANAAAGAQNPAAYLGMQQGQRAQQALYDTYRQSMPEPMARLFALNPQAAEKYGGMFLDPALKATAGALKGPLGESGAMLAALHPDWVKTQLDQQKLEPGGMLVNSLGSQLFGGGGQPQGQPQPPIATPGPQDATGPAPQPQQPAGITQNTNGIIDDESAMRIAQQRVLGDESAMKDISGGMGPLGKLNQAKVQKFVSQLMAQQKLTPGALTERTAKFPAFAAVVKQRTQQGSNMGQATYEFQDIWPKFIEVAQKVNSGAGGLNRFPTFNAFSQWLQEHSGQPDVAEMKQYIDNTLPAIYGRAISGNNQRPLDADKRHIRETLNKYWNAGQLQAAGVALDNEFMAARNAIPKQINTHKSQFGLGDPIPPNVEAEAQAAIKAGKPANKIIERLQEHGFDTKRLEKDLGR